MNNSDSNRLNRWIKTIAGLPKWVLVVGILALMVVGALIISFISPGLAPEASATPVDSNGVSLMQDPLTNGTSLVLGVFFKLILVVVLIVGVALVFNKWRGGAVVRSGKRMVVKESLHLAQRRSLYLVRVDDQEFLIGGTDQNISLISPLIAKNGGLSNAGSDGTDPEPFNKILSSTMMGSKES